MNENQKQKKIKAEINKQKRAGEAEMKESERGKQLKKEKDNTEI